MPCDEQTYILDNFDKSINTTNMQDVQDYTSGFLHCKT